MEKRFWYILAASQMIGVGDALKEQDDNNTGNDDMAGSLIKGVATALKAFARGDIKGFRGALKTIADSIDTFLETA